MMNKEEIIKELDKQNRELGEELSLTKDKLDKTLFEKDHYKHLYSELKKQKDDVVEYIKSAIENDDIEELKDGRHLLLWNEDLDKLLRMLGEIE